MTEDDPTGPSPRKRGQPVGSCDASLPDASAGGWLVPCGLSPARGAFVSMEQAYEGHLVDALALRGDEGRSTLR